MTRASGARGLTGPAAIGRARRPRGLSIREARGEDRPAVDAFLAERNADLVARLGELVDARDHPALVAEAGGQLVGVLAYVVGDDSLEVLTLHAADPWRGTGTALLDTAVEVALARGCRRLWLVTTNDNVDALRFYQRRGLRLARLHTGAVDRSRATLKPGIPAVGAHGIPLRDELELEMPVEPASGRA